MWRTLTFLERLKCKFESENNKRRRNWGRTFLDSQHFGGGGRAKTSRWGLRQVTSRSIIHMDLHIPNNKLVSAWLEHFWCTNEPRAYMDSQNSLRPKLGGSHHLPPYNILYG
jgi:hypothetical protein